MVWYTLRRQRLMCIRGRASHVEVEGRCERENALYAWLSCADGKRCQGREVGYDGNCCRGGKESSDMLAQHRQLERRASDEQVQRFTDRRLCHVPTSTLETVVSEDGLSVRACVKLELENKKQDRVACLPC